MLKMDGLYGIVDALQVLVPEGTGGVSGQETGSSGCGSELLRVSLDKSTFAACDGASEKLAPALKASLEVTMHSYACL